MSQTGQITAFFMKVQIGKIPCVRCGFTGKVSQLLDQRLCPKCKIEMPKSNIQATEFKLADKLRKILL